METAASIKLNNRADFDFILKPSSHTKAIVVAAAAATPSSASPNGINNKKKKNISAAEFTILTDIEMITFQAAANYTSLKDLIPPPPPPTAAATATPSSVMSPGTNSCRIDSRREIPIKDPLLQHAAWAYLQPMAPDHAADTKRRRRSSFVHKLKGQCSNFFGCFNDVVLVMVKSWFPFSAASAGMRQEEGQDNAIAAAFSAEEDHHRS